MTQTVMTLTLETELVDDLINALKRTHTRLASRHGAAFRRLDRRLDRILSGERAIEAPQLRALGDGRFVVIPPRQLMDIVDEAARLGVI